MNAEARNLIQREALTGGVANAVINALINYFMLRGEGPHRVTVDSITSNEHTVFGGAVPMAVILGFVAGTITFFTFRKKARERNLAPADRLSRPYLFWGFRQVAAGALVVFGLVVALGVLWQRYLGSLTVSTPVAAALTGLIAGVTAWYCTTRTASGLLRES